MEMVTGGARIHKGLKTAVFPHAPFATPLRPNQSKYYLARTVIFSLTQQNRVKPYTSPELSPPENATAGSSRQGVRSGWSLPRAPHDLGYTDGAGSSRGGAKHQTPVVEEGEEEDEDDLPTPAKAMTDACRAAELARSKSRETERLSRASSVLTTLVDSDDDDPPLDPARSKGKGVDRAENEAMRDDASDSSDCVIVEVKSTKENDRIEVGAVVMARWPVEGDYDPGAWFGMVSSASSRSTLY